jgi:uncharacterized protein (DUF2235 family)
MPKKLAIFCDGTWNQASARRTNVVRLFQATLPADKATPPNPQLVYYVKGVGTRWEEQIRGGAFGYGISDNIKSAYSFIVANYESGDEIFLFGFSRGAYTARSIAGLIQNIGVLRRQNLHLVEFGFNKYRDKAPEWHPDGPEAVAFRKKNSHPDESIEFIGVWDTVGALGSPYGVIIGWIVDKVFKCSFHNSKLSSWVQSAYHALAVDERRWPFRPNLWELNARHRQSNADALRAGKIPNYEQCWFPGVHSNVGGGYDNTGLSDLALQWMADRAGHHGLNVDLGLVDCKPEITAKIENSQKPFHQLLAKLFVVYPSKLWLVGRFILPKETRDLACHITPEGDYVRPINLVDDNVDFLKQKKAKDGSYLPKNIP